MEPFIGYILALMIAASPIRETQTWGDITETREEKTARFEETARQLAEVIRDTKRLPYDPYFTAAQMIAIWQHESALALAVDKGLGKHGVGDGGNSFCMAQIRVGKKGSTREGWTGQDLLDDRKKCFRVQLRVLAGSIALCRAAGLGPEDGLASYATGRCVPNDKARVRWNSAHKLSSRVKRPKDPAFQKPEPAKPSE